MQFINSFVSAVANGAMMMMSSTSNHSKTNPVATSPRSISHFNLPKADSSTNSISTSRNESDIPNVINPTSPKLLASKASADAQGRENDVVESSDSLQLQKASLVNPVEVVVNPVITITQQKPQTIDVNKKTNRKSYSEVILTESATSSKNSDFRARPNSMSLNIFNPTNRATPAQTTTRPNNNNGSYAYKQNNSNYNKNSYHKNNRHSVCVIAPTFTRGSTTFNIETKSNSFTKSIGQKPANSNNNTRNGHKFNSKPQTPNININKKK